MLRLQRFKVEVKNKPGAQMYVADNLSRASLADSTSMSDNFQVFAIELDTLTPFDSIQKSQFNRRSLQCKTSFSKP